MSEKKGERRVHRLSLALPEELWARLDQYRLWQTAAIAQRHGGQAWNKVTNAAVVTAILEAFLREHQDLILKNIAAAQASEVNALRQLLETSHGRPPRPPDLPLLRAARRRRPRTARNQPS